MTRYLEYIKKAGVLIEALPYIQRFRAKIIVVKMGGSVLENPEDFESALRDIVFLECIGCKPVIVHGGGKAISSRLKESGIETRFIDGLRYSCEKTIAVVDDVLHNEMNIKIVDAINDFGGKAASLSGKTMLKAEPLDEKYGFVGDVCEVDIAQIKKLHEAEIVPVITPLAVGPDSQIYNINADTAASRIAEGLQTQGEEVAKIVFLSDVPGLLRNPEDEGSLITTLKVDEIPALIEQGIISGGIVPKVESAVHALNTGCRKVHLIDARLQHSLLLEIFTDQGVGTQIAH